MYNAFCDVIAQRAPGKRQIKPTVAVTHLTSIPVDDEEDDEEYKGSFPTNFLFLLKEPCSA